MALGRARRTLPGCVGLRDAPGRVVERAGAGPGDGRGRAPRARRATSTDRRGTATGHRSRRVATRGSEREQCCLLLFNPHAPQGDVAGAASVWVTASLTFDAFDFCRAAANLRVLQAPLEILYRWRGPAARVLPASREFSPVRQTYYTLNYTSTVLYRYR